MNEFRDVDYTRFAFLLHRLWNFLSSNQPYASVLDSIGRYGKSEECADLILAGKPQDASTYELHAAISYWVIRKHVESAGEIKLFSIIRPYAPRSDSQSGTEKFKQIFVFPFFDFLDAQLAVKGCVLAQLRRYKHKIEWFRRKDLLGIYESEGQRKDSGGKSRGEKQLALHLYEYLYDQGVDFSIEPWSISGEADLICAQNSDDRLVADVKIFDPSAGKNKAYVISGFHQVYQYTLDHNEPFGYLVIFKTCEEGLAISSSQQKQSTQFVSWNGKTIFFVVIDLFAHEKSASQRGKHKSYVISEDEFVTQKIDTEEPHEVDAVETDSDTTKAAIDNDTNTTEVNE